MDHAICIGTELTDTCESVCVKLFDKALMLSSLAKDFKRFISLITFVLFKFWHAFIQFIILLTTNVLCMF